MREGERVSARECVSVCVYEIIHRIPGLFRCVCVCVYESVCMCIYVYVYMCMCDAYTPTPHSYPLLHSHSYRCDREGDRESV